MMPRARCTFRQQDVVRAIKAAFAAGAARAQVQIGGIVITAERTANGKLDVISGDDADLDRELAEFEARRGQG
jgi:hypothetical protein